jgi:hypothetical protein
MSNGIWVGPGGMTGNSFVYDGTTYYQWSFSATVDGYAGTVTLYINTTDEDTARSGVEQFLEEYPDELGPISENDGTDGSPDDNDDDDGALADGEGSDYGESA